MSNDSTKPVRSPSYPVMSLKDAVAAVAKIEAQYRTAPVDRTLGAKLIGYQGLSGPANQALAALAAYGLVERSGKGMMRVTSRARAILHAKDSDERNENLRAAGLTPPLFQELMDFFGGVIPPEDGVINYLNRQGFNRNAVRPAAKAFLETVRHLEELGVTDSHGDRGEQRTELGVSDGNTDSSAYGGARVGDMVQWESQGALQFNTPLRVRHVHNDGQWVFVEGSKSGIPMSEVIVQERGATAGESFRKTPPTFPVEQGPGHSEPATEEIEWMRIRLGNDTNVRLLAKGEMGPKEIGKLIRLLKAQRAVLLDEDDEGGE